MFYLCLYLDCYCLSVLWSQTTKPRHLTLQLSQMMTSTCTRDISILDHNIYMSAAKVLKTKNKLFWVLQRKYNKDLHGTQSEHNIDVPLLQEKNPTITSMHTIEVFVDGKADLHVIRKKISDSYAPVWPSSHNLLEPV